MTTNIDPPKDGFAVANNSQRRAAKVAGIAGILAFALDSPMALFELIVSFWLLFKGLKPIAPDQARAGVV
jgi:hypothetical protein